jgi:hypothetical protein
MTNQIAAFEKFLINTVYVHSRLADCTLAAAKQFATQKVREVYPDAMLLAWHVGRTGEARPKLACDFGDKPAWLVFAESRGADLTLVVDDGAFVFVYNTDPTGQRL